MNKGSPPTFAKAVSAERAESTRAGAASAAAGVASARPQGKRNPALDFTKGILVLLMVLYHWINYFVSQEGDFYKYLRFITPSFIFITGFLVANVYLAKYAVDDSRLHKRLLERGLKLLAVFTCLNVAWALVGGPGGMTSNFLTFLHRAPSTYVTGNGKTAAFSVLVPISYVLILSPALLVPCRWHRYFLHETCALLFLAIFILDLNHLQSGNLELFTIGFLGMVLGRLPIERINQMARYPLPLMAAYGAYLLALTVWREIYPLQVVGVCLSLILIYAGGVKAGDRGWVSARIITLGKYSLLAYIVQIAVLVLLSRIMGCLDLGQATVFLSFLGAFGLTVAAVEIVHFARRRSQTLDWLYKIVFA